MCDGEGGGNGDPRGIRLEMSRVDTDTAVTRKEVKSLPLQ